MSSAEVDANIAGDGLDSPRPRTVAPGAVAPDGVGTLGERRIARTLPHGWGPAAAGGPSAAGIPPEYEEYVRMLRQRIQDRLDYPWLAVRQRLRGMVELEIELDRQGQLTRAGILSGDAPAVLREAALSAARRATPLPFPPGVPGRPLTIRLPVLFELR